MVRQWLAKVTMSIEIFSKLVSKYIISNKKCA